MIYIKTIDNEIVGSNNFTIMIIRDEHCDSFDIVCNDVVLASFGNVRAASEVVSKIWSQIIALKKPTINMEDLV